MKAYLIQIKHTTKQKWYPTLWGFSHNILDAREELQQAIDKVPDRKFRLIFLERKHRVVKL